jgi:hypothetical protein
MLSEAGSAGGLSHIDIGPIEFLLCDFKLLFETALWRDSFEQLSQFLRV